MSVRLKKWIRPVLFTLGGVLVGIGYCYLVGCSTASCAITSTPVSSMAYMGLIGWILFGVFGKGCECGCSM